MFSAVLTFIIPYRSFYCTIFLLFSFFCCLFFYLLKLYFNFLVVVLGKLKYPISNLFNKTIIKNLIYYNQNLKNGGIKIIEEYNSLLQKANTLKDEIVTLENHIEAGRQFQGEDMYRSEEHTSELQSPS